MFLKEKRGTRGILERKKEGLGIFESKQRNPSNLGEEIMDTWQNPVGRCSGMFLKEKRRLGAFFLKKKMGLGAYLSENRGVWSISAI